MTAPPLPDGLFDIPAGKLAAVVTSLAMAERPAAVPTTRPDVRLRPEVCPAVPWYRDLFRRVGEPWLWSSRLAMDDPALAAILENPAVDVYAVEHAGTDAGLLELDFRTPDLCELAFLGLAPGLTGRGIGSWLMAHAVHRAWARPITRAWVHTCSLDHPAALAFYERSGFVAFRRQVEVFDDPRRRGWLPVGAAPQVPLL